MRDEILLLEIERLKQMLFIAASDINNLDGSNKFDYLHDLSTRDYFELEEGCSEGQEVN